MTPDEFRSALTNGAEFPVDLLRFMAKQRWAVAYEHDIWINGAADRIESLSTKVRFLEGACTGMREENDALAAERDALRKDAERYRWLRERINYGCDINGGDGLCWATLDWCVDDVLVAPPSLDAAIDAAMGERP